MSERYDSMRKGVKEAIEWEKEEKTGARVREYTAMDVALIRKKTKMSQKEFSRFFFIPLSTLRQWEQGKRVPQGPAQALLRIIDKDAESVLKALHG